MIYDIAKQKKMMELNKPDFVIKESVMWFIDTFYSDYMRKTQSNYKTPESQEYKNLIGEITGINTDWEQQIEAPDLDIIHSSYNIFNAYIKGSSQEVQNFWRIFCTQLKLSERKYMDLINVGIAYLNTPNIKQEIRDYLQQLNKLRDEEKGGHESILKYIKRWRVVDTRGEVSKTGELDAMCIGGNLRIGNMEKKTELESIKEDKPRAYMNMNRHGDYIRPPPTKPSTSTNKREMRISPNRITPPNYNEIPMTLKIMHPTNRVKIDSHAPIMDEGRCCPTEHFEYPDWHTVGLNVPLSKMHPVQSMPSQPSPYIPPFNPVEGNINEDIIPQNNMGELESGTARELELNPGNSSTTTQTREVGGIKGMGNPPPLRIIKVEVKDVDTGPNIKCLCPQDFRTTDRYFLGRGTDCWVTIPDEEMNLQQVAFTYKNESFFMQCLSNHFITLFRVQPNQKVRLHANDYLVIARIHGYRVIEVTAISQDTQPLSTETFAHQIDLHGEVRTKAPNQGSPPYLKIVGATERVHGLSYQFVYNCNSPQQTFSCGRSDFCYCRFMNSPEISGLHCTVGYATGIGWYICDGVNNKSSTNGTFMALNTTDSYPQQPSRLMPLLGSMRFEAGKTQFIVIIYIYIIYVGHGINVVDSGFV